MTTLIARPLLEILPMSSAQSSSRRQSARLQDKEENLSEPLNPAVHAAPTTSIPTTKVQLSTTNARKRKNNYDEDDDGFVFARVKKQKPKPKPQTPAKSSDAAVPPSPTPSQQAKVTRHKSPASTFAVPALPSTQRMTQNVPLQHEDGTGEPSKKKRKRMSFSTPAPKSRQPVRRSKRLSSEHNNPDGSPLTTMPTETLKSTKIRRDKGSTAQPPAAATSPAQAGHEEEHSSTTIALPFADTPVITRNKAMREGKTTKGDRRSSLGLRGRRASSLIDSGTSNALPHAEVAVTEFYKHIEGDLLEPRRLRQLLSWCGTRAMHAKPHGATFEEASAKSAARVIEEELLKDLNGRAELSDWFSRDEAPAPVVPVPERPNPRNVQNAKRITELETQIARLTVERQALEALLDPPLMLDPQCFPHAPELGDIDRSLLSASEVVTVDSLQQRSRSTQDLTHRLQKLVTNVQPAVDTFADSVHQLAQYQNRADAVASQVLALCAEKLAERDRQGRRKALGTNENSSPGRDLNNVLRGLSKAGR